MTVKIHVEGGGDSKELQIRCREAFSKLIAKAGFVGRMPRIKACGGRDRAYDSFCTAAAGPDDYYPMLLVDSEDPVKATTAWGHLNERDGWVRPAGADDDQAQMMVTCMETWILADRETLSNIFGADLQVSALLSEAGLEARSRQEVQQALENATRGCGRDKAYSKGRRSFQVLAEVNPEALRSLSYFRRFLETLQRHL